MSWPLLALAIACEVVATSCLRAAGAGDLRALAVVLVGYVVSFGLLAWFVQRVELGIVYAIWAGGGTLLVALSGVAFLGESIGLAKALGIAMVVGGVVVLKLSQPI